MKLKRRTTNPAMAKQRALEEAKHRQPMPLKVFRENVIGLFERNFKTRISKQLAQRLFDAGFLDHASINALFRTLKTMKEGKNSDSNKFLHEFHAECEREHIDNSRISELAGNLFEYRGINQEAVLDPEIIKIIGE